MRFILLLLLIATSTLIAGDSFMESWKPYDFGMFYSAIFFIISIPIWLLIAIWGIFGKNEIIAKGFGVVTGINIAIFIISFLFSGVNGYINSQKYMPGHSFQKPYEYGVYKNSSVKYEILSLSSCTA